MTLIALKPTQQVVDIVGALGGTWRGYTAMCRCPAHEDATPSLSIRQGHDAILVHCFAGCAPDDVLREIARLTLTRRFEPPRTARNPSCANIERLWADALPLIGTPAEHYLAHRRITTPFRDLRYHPRCPWGPAPTTRLLPALLVAAREGLRLRAVQRIFLDVARGGYLAKVMLGRPAGGSWQGRPVTDTLALAEGFESAARFTELNGISCWAPLGAARLDRIHIPDTVTNIVSAEDNDAEGRRARRRAWSAYRSRGFVLRRMPPPQRFGDWAEVDIGA